MYVHIYIYIYPYIHTHAHLLIFIVAVLSGSTCPDFLRLEEADMKHSRTQACNSGFTTMAPFLSCRTARTFIRGSHAVAMPGYLKDHGTWRAR